MLGIHMHKRGLDTRVSIHQLSQPATALATGDLGWRLETGCSGSRSSERGFGKLMIGEVYLTPF